MPGKRRTVSAQSGDTSTVRAFPRAAVVSIVIVAAAALVPLAWKGLYESTSPVGGSSVQEKSESKDSDVQRPISQSKLKDLLRRLNHAAYVGDYETVRALLNGETWWNDPTSQLLSHQSPVLVALQGRHDSLSRDVSDLIGRHEEVIQYLMEFTQLSTGHSCPIYFAAHYRNIKALEILLDSLDINSSLSCLTTLDSTGETALHSAAKSKASGFARLLARARKSRPSQEMLDLLGLSNNLELCATANVLTLPAINSLVSHVDFDLILERLHRENVSLNLTSILDRSGNTVLHLAVYGGRKDLVETLLHANLTDVNSRNDHGLTPLHLAFAGHFCEIAELLVSYGAQGNATDEVGRTPRDVVSYSWERCSLTGDNERRSQEVEFQPDTSGGDLWSEYVESGWGLTSQDIMASRDCAIDVRNSTLSPEDYIGQYKAIFKPVLIQGLVSSWPAWKHWTKKELVQRYGHLKFTVSDIPYAKLYHGTEAGTEVVSLAEYVTQFQTANTQRPQYIFDGQVLNRNPLLLADAYPIPDVFANFTVLLRQFILGPKNSGSPPHFHGHAFNGLVFGLKRWYLWPPTQAHFAFDHAKEWEEGYSGGGHGGPLALVCVQGPGDVMYVPENWGHAVVNVADSVAVAFEFT